MAVTREQFEKGMTWEEYKAQMTRNRDRLEANEQTVVLDPDDVQFFSQLPNPINGLVLVEDWCGDVINNIPVVTRLAEASGKLNLRFLLRDQSLDIMDQYLNRGQFRSIPLVVLFDQDFRELGHWHERPASVTAAREKMLTDLYAAAPELQGVARDTSPAQLPDEARARLTQANADFRTQNRPSADRDVAHDIREIVARSLVSK